MKKLLIALGALTLMGATAAANEFRPTGSLKQEIRWYSDKEDVDAEGFRLTLAEGGIRFTENFYADYRVRDFIRTSDEVGSNTKDIRTRLYYDHGTLGDTQIDVRQRLEIRSTQSYNRFSYTPEFNFAEYIPGFSTFKLRPVLRYEDDNNGNTTLVRTGADMLTYLPVYSGERTDFGVEFNTYFRYDEFKGENRNTQNIEGSDNNVAVDVEVYTYLSYELGEWNGVNFGLYHEFGLDPYTWYDRNIAADQRDRNNTDQTWTIYNDFELQFSYDVNGSTSIYGALAVEHANTKGQEYASDFKWQAYPYIGWRTKF